MKAAIQYCNFFDYNGIEIKIGGIETYLRNLAGVCQQIGMQPTIYQFANRPFNKCIDGIPVKGIPVMHLPPRKRTLSLFKAVSKEIDTESDIIIFGSDIQSVKSKCKHAISIQHGIIWDLPNRFMTGHAILFNGLIGRFYKTMLRMKFINSFTRCPFRVCVDYNFLNWFNTYQVSASPGKNWVIPNFCVVANEEQLKVRTETCCTIKIIFARRFCEYRGTRLIAEAAKAILSLHHNIEFTFAGEGPDEGWLRNFFADYHNVQFIKYSSKEALHIHLEHHIAVIASLASEGTSLAVAEAMGAGCAVIATAVGGITNMIIDGYNGLLVAPAVVEITTALERIIQHPELMQRLGKKAYEVASQSFSVDNWRIRWQEVLETVIRS